MKIQKLRDLTVEELNIQLKDFQEELFNLRFQQSMSQLENANRMVLIKKNIAQAKTIITEKEKSLR